jgi:hypothetical protein
MTYKKQTSAPATRNAYSWDTKFWSVVLTLAKPNTLFVMETMYE